MPDMDLLDLKKGDTLPLIVPVRLLQFN